MGKKTDEQIIEEARALYIKGQLEGNSLQLMKIAHKGNPEACYLISQFHLELANKRTKEKDREIYTKSAKIFLEKAVAAGHKEAIALMENRFGSSNGDAIESISAVEKNTSEPEKHIVETSEIVPKISDTPANAGNTSKRDAMLEIIGTIEDSFKLEPIKSFQTSAVEKFIRNHNLGISLSDVIAYRDTAVFSSGKKGHILTEEFLYYSDNGKRGAKVEFSGIVSAESSKGYEFYVIYTNGERKTFSHTEYMSFAEYYVKLINAFVASENKAEEKTIAGNEEFTADNMVKVLEDIHELENIVSAFAEKMTELEAMEAATEVKMDEPEEESLEAEAREKAEVEEQARIEAERLRAEEEAKAKAEELKRLEEENAKAEAAARAKAEELKRLEEENAKAEAAARAKAEELKRLEEENAKAEAAARAKAEEIKRLEEENAKAEAASAELEKPAPDSTEKVLEDIHELEKEIEDAFAEMFAKLEATESAAEEKSDEPEEESLEEAESVEESLEDDIAMMCIEAAMTLYEEGKVDDAIEIWREFAEKGHLLAIYYLIIALDEKEEYGEALDWARDMWNICPDEELSQVAEEFIEKFEGNINNLFEQGVNLYSAGNYEEAVKWFESAAEQGAVDAQYNLAIMYDKGKGIAEDKQEAFKWYKSAAEQGVKEAQYNLAYMYYYGEGIEKNLREAFKWYKSAAVQDLESAQFKLAEMYYNGEGTEKNLREALKFYGVSAEKGCREAQYKLAEMYYNGEGNEQNFEEALKWYKSAAEQGDIIAAMKLAVRGEELYSSGKYAEAMGYFQASADTGEKRALTKVALMYDEGKGVPVDKQAAFKWYSIAAKMGDANAQAILGALYYQGEVIPADKQEARKWLKKAAEQGHAEARRLLDELL